MKTKIKKKHDIVVRLCEGGIENIDGHALEAVEIPNGFDACHECEMDSACSEQIKEICIACDEYKLVNHILRFAHKKITNKLHPDETK